MNHAEVTRTGSAMALSFLVGSVAGAAAVLLLAPKARKESAERIRGATREMKERAAATLDAAKEKVVSTVAQGRDLLHERRAALETAVAAGRQAYHDAKSGTAHVA